MIFKVPSNSHYSGILGLNWTFPALKATKLILILQKKDSGALLESSEDKHLSPALALLIPETSEAGTHLSTEGVSLLVRQHQFCLLPKMPCRDRNYELITAQQPGPGC